MSYSISAACVPLKMPGVAKNVLMQLAQLANDQGFAFPSINHLCKCTCWCRSAVIEGLNFLEEQKAIKPNRESGCNTTYWITPENWRGERFPDKALDPSAERTSPLAVPVGQTDSTRPPNGVDPSSKRTLIPINPIELNTPPTPKGAESGFDEFWKTYPKKWSLESAQKEWEKLAPDAQLQAQILKAVQVQAASEAWQRMKGKFVPLASNWLSKEGWLDVVIGANGSAANGDGLVHVEGSKPYVEEIAKKLCMEPWDSFKEQFSVYRAKVMKAWGRHQQAGEE